jgi:pyrimidine oxygenase
MKLGVFMPTTKRGWLITTAAPHFDAHYDFFLRLVQRAEHYGFDFALAPVKYRGFGGPSDFWGSSPEPITLMAGIAQATSRIKLFASIPTLTISPAITARMAVTLDEISKGRFGLNIVSGWQPAEYDQMSLWPGDDHFSDRYDYATEYVQIMQELWSKGQSDFKGKYFTMKDCHLSPLPKHKIELVCAGQSDRGMAFCAEHGDYAFCIAAGLNAPQANVNMSERFDAQVKKYGRKVGMYFALMVIADETDEAAFAKWKKYNAEVDYIAVGALFGQASAGGGSDSSIKTLVTPEAQAAARAALPEGAVNMNFGTLIGSYASVARMLDEIAAIPNTSGAMLILDDWIEGMENFGKRVLPLMKSRQTVSAMAS